MPRMKSSVLGSRLVLFVIAAVIFAPGWYGRGRSEPPLGGDLAARILAPTWDEGAVARAAPEVKPLLRGHYERFHSVTFAYLAAFIPGTLALAFLWLIVPNRVRSILRFHTSTRVSRAPPVLQLA